MSQFQGFWGGVGWWSVIQALRGGCRLAVGGNRGLRLTPELLGGGRRVSWGKCKKEEPTGRGGGHPTRRLFKKESEQVGGEAYAGVGRWKASIGRSEGRKGRRWYSSSLVTNVFAVGVSLLDNLFLFL